MPIFLDELSTEELRALGKISAAIVPVGSVEPHGPHLSLGTDTTISVEASVRAVALLRARGVDAFVAPSIPYGVTEYARGFPGALSIPPAVLTSFLHAVVQALLGEGFSHVCLVNNHLEPAHDEAVRAAVREFPPRRASVACPLTRRWARTLSDEFKRGDCHAGRYETSLVLAARGHVRDVRAELPKLAISLATEIKAGKSTFREMGIDRAYTGAPAEGTREEGEELYAKLAEMIATEVTEAIATQSP